MTEINDEYQEMIRKLSRYFETPEGQEKLKKIQEAVEEFERNLRKQEEVTPEQLLQRVTI